MAGNSLAILLTDPGTLFMLGLLVILALVCFEDAKRRGREVAEYEADPARYLELQRQGKRR